MSGHLEKVTSRSIPSRMLLVRGPGRSTTNSRLVDMAHEGIVVAGRVRRVIGTWASTRWLMRSSRVVGARPGHRAQRADTLRVLSVGVPAPHENTLYKCLARCVARDHRSQVATACPVAGTPTDNRASARWRRRSRAPILVP